MNQNTLISKPIVIVGAGIAGATLAWQCHFAGVRPILYDRNDPAASSRAAAGLITPVTGKRLAPSWKIETVWPVALAFYRRVEKEIGKPILSVQPAVRLFQSADERTAFHDREELLAPFLVPINPPLNDAFIQPYGGFSMAPAAVLDVKTYLAKTRSVFQVIQDDFDSSKVSPDCTTVMCRGFAGRDDPHFPGITFNPTKGDILSLEIPDLVESRTIHAAGWLTRVSDGTYRAGSTYERVDLTANPTAFGREDVERKLKTFLKCPYTVIDHQATARPIIRESRPVLGIHPTRPHLAYFNGLGSKGSLMAPYYAGQLANAILGRGQIDADVDVAKWKGGM